MADVLRFSLTEAAAIATQDDLTAVPREMASVYGRPDHPEDVEAIATNIADRQARLLASLQHESCATLDDENDLPILRRLLVHSAYFNEARLGNYELHTRLKEKLAMAEGIIDIRHAVVL